MAAHSVSMEKGFDDLYTIPFYLGALFDLLLVYPIAQVSSSQSVSSDVWYAAIL